VPKAETSALYVGITDGEWYNLLARQEHLDELNFWQPGGSHHFQALPAGGLFLFKLHSPDNCIVGGGIFAHATLLPVSLAWETFGIANGAGSLPEMRRRIERYRRKPAVPQENYQIGCILLEQPFFFARKQWIPAPPGWHRNIVQGKRYDPSEHVGRQLWEQVQGALAASGASLAPCRVTSEPVARFGAPTLVHPRLGQGSFRIVVTDAYGRRCAVTRERTLPALDAAHIRPYSEGGEHRVDNGLLMRRDLHALFDRGYVTVTPELTLEISRRIKEDFENGKDYYAMNGRTLWVPPDIKQRPDPQHLRWHNESCFLR
jgi:putative restriction endonuclease